MTFWRSLLPQFKDLSISQKGLHRPAKMEAASSSKTFKTTIHQGVIHQKNWIRIHC